MNATWILADGRTISAEVPEGHNLMEAAQKANVPGVVGECGGSMSCATCHVYVDPAWTEAAGQPQSMEDSMLDITEADRSETSRLSCQIKMSAALSGIVLHVPAV
jgi:ferredoxin, 2Fe-2S